MRTLNKTILFLIIFISSITAQKSSKLDNLKDALDDAGYGRAFLKFIYQEYDTAKSVNDVLNTLEEHVKSDTINTKEKQYLKKYNIKIEQLLSGILFTGAGDLIGFVYPKFILPIRFVQKDNKLTFIVSSLAAGVTYNTIRLSAKERAAKAIENIIIPAMKDLAFYFNKTEVENIGIALTYCTKDFVKDDSKYDIEAETVSLITGIAIVKKYFDSEITQEELVEQSDIYMCDRDQSICGTKKIKVTLE